MMIAASWSYEWFFETDEPLLPAEFKIAGWLLVAIAFLPVPVKFVVNCVEFKKRKVSEYKINLLSMVSNFLFF